MPTKTSRFGTSKREGHDASDFYNRNLYSTNGVTEERRRGGEGQKGRQNEATTDESLAVFDLQSPVSNLSISESPNLQSLDWANRIYCHSSTEMLHVPDASIGLAFTSPPYNVGKEYDPDLDLADYLNLIEQVGSEVQRVLVPGGRYVVNIANLGRRPYLPIHAKFYELHERLGFLAMGEIIWQKSKGASGNCAWGSWMSAKAPRLRDIHEYLLVFAKDHYSRPDKGQSDIERDQFMQSTLSVWEIPPESAKRVGHPAPFPVALAERVIHLYSYVGDVVLDPFSGSGTTAVAAKQNNRHYVGYDISEEYCTLANERLKL